MYTLQDGLNHSERWFLSCIQVYVIIYLRGDCISSAETDRKAFLNLLAMSQPEKGGVAAAKNMVQTFLIVLELTMLKA